MPPNGGKTVKIMEWLIQNIGSIIVLALLVALLALLIVHLVKSARAAKRSPNPGCYGCPHAKDGCGGGCHCSPIAPDGSSSCPATAQDVAENDKE